jgi:spore coat protein U-like protein
MKKLCGYLVLLGVVLCGMSSAFAADTNTLTVSANVVGTCRFNNATSTLAFGALDVTSAADANANGSAVTFWCTNGAAYTITHDDGLNESGVNAPNMEHTVAAGEFLPYTLNLNPTAGTGSGPSTPVNLAITGTVANADYIDALAGDYEDTVTITINP